MKALYLIACILLIVAIAAEVNAKRQYSTAAILIAKSAWRPITATQTKQDVDASIVVGGRFSMAGFISAWLGAFCWVASNAKERQGTPVLPIVLLAVYALMLFVVV